jgi:hypothetical protein
MCRSSNKANNEGLNKNFMILKNPLGNVLLMSLKTFWVTTGQKITDLINELLISYKAMGCNMSLKIHILDSHLVDFPENLGAVSDEHGERFHPDISLIEKRY